MKDVAKLAGVSVATVSATISGRDYVSPELQERVRAAITKLNYRPNVVASNLKKGRTSLIGLIVPDITNPFYTDLIAEFQSCARADKLSVILGISDQDPTREIELIEYVAGQHAEALVVGSCGYEGESIGALRNAAAHLNLVLLDCIPEGIQADKIESDNFLAGRLATNHILSFGHRRVAVITGPSGARSSDERLRGYHEAMRDAGIAASSALQLDGGFRIEQAYEATLSLLGSRSRPTAIFVCNNLMLIGVMRAIADRGLRVPEDISIVNVDDFPWASAFRPAMTTVRQQTTEIARAAYQTAKSRMEGRSGERIHSVFKPELVERASCAKPAAKVRKP
jgi:LacI family transcriptional regulator